MFVNYGGCAIRYKPRGEFGTQYVVPVYANYGAKLSNYYSGNKEYIAWKVGSSYGSELTIFRYNHETKTVKEISVNEPTIYNGSTVVVFPNDNYIAVVGGKKGTTYGATKHVYLYKMEGDDVSLVYDGLLLSKARCNPVVGITDRTMIITGGDTDGNTLISSAEAYTLDPATDTLKKTSSTPPYIGNRRRAGVLTVNGYFYAAGGEVSYNQFTQYIYRYKGTTRYTDAGKLSETKYSPCLCTANGFLFVVGGKVDYQTETKKIEAFKIGTNGALGTPVVSTMNRLSGCVGAFILGGKLYACGGIRDGTAGDTQTIIEEYEITSAGNLVYIRDIDVEIPAKSNYNVGGLTLPGAGFVMGGTSYSGAVGNWGLLVSK